ncbi:MAG: DUF4249 domain-containing protein [Muribaculaceae bacterium]|nr:DUF4249 domain-containing protein [Muribaculaceae bacterium]
MGILKHVIPSILLILLSACYEDFTPDIPSEPVLCVNSLITAGKPIKIDISRTRLYSDEDSPTTVDDAVVSLFVDGVLQTPDYIPNEGDSIRIHVVSEKYGCADAEVIVPVSTPIKSAKLNPLLTEIWKDDLPSYEMLADIGFNLDLQLTFDDSPIVKNFYRYTAKAFSKAVDKEAYSTKQDDTNGYQTDFYPGDLRYDFEPLFSEHIGTFESVMGADAYGFTFFTDSSFSGESCTLHLYYLNGRCFIKSTTWDDEIIDCGLELTLHTISQSYYNLAYYQWIVNEAPMHDLSEIGFGEPIWGYSNVSTGAGIVAAQACSTITVSLHDFLEECLKGTR